ncbi:MAG: CheR family methyltransferase [Rhodopila sp.]
MPALTEGEFSRFSEFFYRRTGMAFGDSKRYFVDRRVLDRVARAAPSSFESYFAMLRRDPAGPEMEQLINLLTVNETYFWREGHQLEMLTSSILPEIGRGKVPGDTIRIWSAPCSTGEEPYSIAIQLLQTWPDVDRYNVEIIASDIDTAVLDSARAGIFDQRSVQRLAPQHLRRFFSPCGEGRYRIIDDLRNSISFVHANVSDRASMARFQAIDVVFCRNMLIYFDDRSRKEAAESLFDSLRPGGFILLGHSESMSRICGLFDIRKFPEGIVYQKPIAQRFGG